MSRIGSVCNDGGIPKYTPPPKVPRVPRVPDTLLSLTTLPPRSRGSRGSRYTNPPSPTGPEGPVKLSRSWTLGTLRMDLRLRFRFVGGGGALNPISEVEISGYRTSKKRFQLQSIEISACCTSLCCIFSLLGGALPPGKSSSRVFCQYCCLPAD